MSARNMNIRHYHWMIALLAAASVDACGGMYTENVPRSIIDPAILGELPERDPRGAWPQDDLPSSGVLFGDGTGARFLDDYIVVRPTSPEGLEALLANHPYLTPVSRLTFERDTGEFLFPRGDLWISPDGTLEEVEVDVLLQVDWSVLEDSAIRTMAATEDGTSATFSSNKAEALIRVVRMLEQRETRKLVSARPVTLSVVLAEPSASATTETTGDCPCVTMDGTTPRFDSSMVVELAGGEILECGSGLYTSGTNMLMLENASINTTLDPSGHLQDIRLWVLPYSEEPIQLPGLGALVPTDGSTQSLEAFATWKPMLAHGMSLAGPVSDDTRCGWLPNASNGALEFRNAGQWFWSDPDADESVILLMYESDPGDCVHGLYCTGLDDDFIGVTVVEEAQTRSGVAHYGLDDITLSLQTYGECTATECDPDPYDCSSPINGLDPALLGTPCPSSDDPEIDNVCTQGRYACLDNAIVCTDVTYKGTELCNGEDDDCNGIVDDGPWTGAACSSYVIADTIEIPASNGPNLVFRSACEPGTKSCEETSDGVFEIQCIGEVGPSGPEQCGYVELGTEHVIWDEDCDGSFNEGCHCDSALDDSRPCGLSVGDCDLGVQICDGDTWTECCEGDAGQEPECEGYSVPAIHESCGGGDEDCNGVGDLELTNACAQCIEVGALPPDEVCNDIDDDCDGQVDEGLTDMCGNCLDNIPVEICNGVDDDCDLEIDEGVDGGFAVSSASFNHISGAPASLISVPNPPGDTFGYFVFVSHYTNNLDDDYQFAVTNCINTGTNHECTISSNSASNTASISGQLIVLGAQSAAGTVATLPEWVAPNGSCGYFPFTASNDLLIAGVSSYIAALDDDFGFTAEPVSIDGGQAVYSCGFAGAPASEARGFATRISGTCDTYTLTVDQVVFEGNPVTIEWQGRTNVVPLLGVSSLIPNTDDDPAWAIDCGQAGVDYLCQMSVTNGSLGTHIRVRGILLDLP